MAKTVLIPQTTFTATDTGGGNYTYHIDHLLVNAESINVVFDGVKYENIMASEEDEGDTHKYIYRGQTFGFAVVSTLDGGK